MKKLGYLWGLGLIVLLGSSSQVWAQPAGTELGLPQQGSVYAGQAEIRLAAQKNVYVGQTGIGLPGQGSIYSGQAEIRLAAPAGAEEGAEDEQTDGNAEITKKYTAAVVRLVNQARAKKGLAPLIVGKKLKQAAALRADELTVEFSHTRPDGTSCFTVLREFDLHYRDCGENIAQGQEDAEEVMNTWMHSKGHRANILSRKYRKIGVGYNHENKCWVQLFTN